MVSVVIPCLNEEETIARCVAKAHTAFSTMGIEGEVVVADNGSTDRSAQAAREAGAVVVDAQVRGYGAAYLTGFAAASGAFLVMGDGDDTYDFLDIPRFVAPLLEGRADLVMGNRFSGEIKPGAMSWSHRWIGNPVLSGMLRLLFGTSVGDSHCGMRALTRAAWDQMRLGALGMEFASEMVVAALRERLRIVELPITYYPRLGESKLESLRDAWRHTRFMLMFSPSYLFLLPGTVLVIVGVGLMGALIGGPRVFLGRRWDYHPLLFGATGLMLGYNLVLFDVLAKSYSMAAGFARQGRWDGPLLRWFKLERGLVLGFLLMAVGLIYDLRIVLAWIRSGYGELMAVRQVALGMAVMVVGVQTIFASFLIGLMRVRRR